MRTRLLLISMVVGAAAVIVIVFAVSASEGRSRLTKVVDCIQKAGYRTTTAIHDDGRRSVASSAQDPDVQLLLAGSDRTRQVHEPSDTFTVVDRDSSAIADIRVPQRSATTIRQYHSLPTRTRITIASWRA